MEGTDKAIKQFKTVEGAWRHPHTPSWFALEKSLPVTAALAMIKRQESLPVYNSTMRMSPSMLDHEGEIIPEWPSESHITPRMNSPVTAAKWHYDNDKLRERNEDALRRPFSSLLQVEDEPDLVSSSEDEEEELPVPPRKSRKFLKIISKKPAQTALGENKVFPARSFTNSATKTEDAVLPADGTTMRINHHGGDSLSTVTLTSLDGETRPEQYPAVDMDVQDEVLDFVNTFHSAKALVITPEISHRAFTMRAGGKRLCMIVDSGCTAHIFSGPRECMKNYRPIRTKISTANSQSGGLWAIGVGELPVIMRQDDDDFRATLQKVLHAPSSAVSLFSVPAFLSVLGERAAVVFFETKAVLEVDGQISIPVGREENLYTLDVELQHPAEEEFAAVGVVGELPTVTDPFDGCTNEIERSAIALHLTRCHEPWRKTLQHMQKGKDLGSKTQQSSNSC